jgi:hypothetical protein
MSDKPSTETKWAPARGIAIALFIAFMVMGFGLIFWPLLVVGFLILLLAIPLGLMTRAGTCPNCGASNLMLGGGAQKCSDCKHRLVLRDKRLVDVT